MIIFSIIYLNICIIFIHDPGPQNQSKFFEI